MSEPRFTVETAMVLAEVAHNRQKDKLKRPYRDHVLAVGDALADFDDDIRIAGYLHDIAEDTPITRQALLDMGVSERAVGIIERLTRRFQDDPDDYEAGIRMAAENHDAALVKIADNAHNSLPERVQALAEKWPDKPPVTRYAEARPVLYAAVPEAEIRMILERINPSLLDELNDMVDDADETDYLNLSYEPVKTGPLETPLVEPVETGPLETPLVEPVETGPLETPLVEPVETGPLETPLVEPVETGPLETPEDDQR